MASARRDDIYSQELQYENPNKDKVLFACFSAFGAALAAVNFGYALGFTAEAGLSDSFKHKQNLKNPLECSVFDVFAVSFGFFFFFFLIF